MAGEKFQKRHISTREASTSLEKYTLQNVGGLLISGDRGTGKSHLLKTLCLQYNYQPTDIGNGIRENFTRKTGQTYNPKSTRTIEDNILVDLNQWELLTQATLDQPIITTSWLGPFFVKNMEKTGLIKARIVKILLYTDPPEIALQRAAKRDADNLGISEKEAYDNNQRLLEKDIKEWVDTYKPLKELSLYRPGSGLYDLEIDVSRFEKEPANIVNTWLLENGFAKKVT